jgi:hypothetical protein
VREEFSLEDQKDIKVEKNVLCGNDPKTDKAMEQQREHRNRSLCLMVKKKKTDIQVMLAK